MTQSGLPPPHVRIVSPEGAFAQATTEADDPRRSISQVAKDIGLFFAAPFVTLAYVTLFPFIGMAMLAQAWRRRKHAG
jgi:hypothetical protein